jgi:hypothetical protein
MAEEAEVQDTGAEATASGVDPAAAALALGGASREDADAFLQDQRKVLHKQAALIDDQRHHLAAPATRYLGRNFRALGAVGDFRHSRPSPLLPAAVGP